MSDKHLPSPDGSTVPTYTQPPPPAPSPREQGITLSKSTPEIRYAKPPPRRTPIVNRVMLPVGAGTNISMSPPKPRPIPTPVTTPIPTPSGAPTPIYPDQQLPSFVYHPSLSDDQKSSYRAARQRDNAGQCLVTFVMPAVGRTDCTKATIEGIVKHARFPHRFKLICHPRLKKLQGWCRSLGIDVVQGFYFPIVKAKDAIVKLCDTKYLFMFDNDLQPVKRLKPMLDFMEAHPDVGVCACSMKGSPKHSVLHFGADFHVRKRVFVVEPYRDKSPYRYCKYVHHGATLFRMKLFDEVAYDTDYPGQGHEHEDLFLQIAQTDWKVVSYNDCPVTPLPEGGGADYRSIRNKGLKPSYEYFRRKWNIKSKSRGKRK